MKHVDILFKVKKPTENGNWKVLKTKTKNGRTTLSSKCAL